MPGNLPHNPLGNYQLSCLNAVCIQRYQWSGHRPREIIMSLEMLLRLDGVTGGSRNYHYKGWSEVLSWHWELLSNRTTLQSTDNDKKSFGEISLTKPIGRDSAEIMLLYAQGKTIQYAELNMVPVVSKREAQQKYLSLHMEDVLIKSIITGGVRADDHFNETIVLIFNKIKYEYNFHIASDPGENNASYTDFHFAWDIARDQEWQQEPG